MQVEPLNVYMHDNFLRKQGILVRKYRIVMDKKECNEEYTYTVPYEAQFSQY